MNPVFERLCQIRQSPWRPEDPVSHTQILGTGAKRSLQAGFQCENPAAGTRWAEQVPNSCGSEAYMSQYIRSRSDQQPGTPTSRTLFPSDYCSCRMPRASQDIRRMLHCQRCHGSAQDCRRVEGGTDNG